MSENQKLRELPAVHEVLERLPGVLERFPRALVVAEVRRAIDARREAIRGGITAPAEPVERVVEEALDAWTRPSMRRVINATGVILHTNLGRAPLGPLEIHPGYSNLEYDLRTGRRGKRDEHTSALLEQLLGAPAIAVNNNAAAVYLVLQELAAGGEALVSRGELIEIGDGFRIPDIIERAGVTLREVGTTNRTSIGDYAAAISGRTRVIVRVHRSNFRIEGFTARPELPELAALGRERGIPVYEDLGSGCLADLRAWGIGEPVAATSLRAGAALVSFSGDKLLGGPQAGIVAGRSDLVARLRRNPVFRALRLDKLVCQVLEQTLRHTLLEQWDRIPTLAMIRQDADRIRERAARILRDAGVAGELVPGDSVLGGGSTPQQTIPTCLIALGCADARSAEHALRSGAPPVIARIEDERLLLDLRTVAPEEETELIAALRRVPGTCLRRC